MADQVIGVNKQYSSLSQCIGNLDLLLVIIIIVFIIVFCVVCVFMCLIDMMYEIVFNGIVIKVYYGVCQIVMFIGFDLGFYGFIIGDCFEC